MLNENNIVEKSKALVWAQFKDYGSGELKILDTYLSRINARDPDSSYVTFSKKEYAELMGLDADIRTSQLKNYTRGLLGNVVTIEMPGEGYVQYPLFSEAKCTPNKETGQVEIKIDCNPKLKQVFFDIAQDGYVRYQLKNVIALRSQYSIRLYSLLKDRPFGWTVEIPTLRKLINATSPTYDEFKRFNGLILKKALEEINEITDITVEAKNKRTGRVVTAIAFTVKNKTVYKQLPPEAEKAIEIEAEEMEDPEDPFTVPDADDELAVCAEALPEDFTRDQVEALRYMAVKIVPYDPHDSFPYECRLAEYLRSKVLQMKASTTPVKKPYPWIKAVIEAELKKQQ